MGPGCRSAAGQDRRRTEDVRRRVSRPGSGEIPARPGGAALDVDHAGCSTQDQDTVSITHEVLLVVAAGCGPACTRTGLELTRQDLEAAASTWN